MDTISALPERAGVQQGGEQHASDGGMTNGNSGAPDCPPNGVDAGGKQDAPGQINYGMDSMQTESLDVAELLSNKMMRANSHGGQGQNGTGSQPRVQGPTDWIGEPIENKTAFGATKTCYSGFLRDGMEVSVGDFVYVETGERVKELEKIELYIGQVKELYNSHDVYDQEHRVAKMATIQWYYRPEELDLDGPLYVFDKEVFRGDEIMPVPLHMVVGTCRIVSPKEYWDNKVSAAARKVQGIGSDIFKAPADLYVCSKEYIKEDRRVIPLDEVQDDAPAHARDYRLEDKVLHPPKGLLDTQASQREGKGKAKRGRKPGTKVEKIDNGTIAVRGANIKTHSSGTDTFSLYDLAGVANNDARKSAGAKSRGPKSKVSAEDTYSIDDASQPKPVRRSRGGRIIKEPADPYNVREYSSNPAGDYMQSAPAKKKAETVSRGKYGRWAPDRFLLAQKNLVDTMKLIGATHPHKAILRPRLREEARRSVGDTGLLDYLLKHLADEIVSPDGEKLRRRHNATGHMEYWLQDPTSAHEEDMMVNDEMNALSVELRQVREARNLLQTVREEAAQAVKVVEGVKAETPIPTSGHTQPLAVDQKTFSILKSQYESHVRQYHEETNKLHQTIATMSKDFTELKRKLEDVTTLVGQLKGLIAKGNLEATIDTVLFRE